MSRPGTQAAHRGSILVRLAITSGISIAVTAAAVALVATWIGADIIRSQIDERFAAVTSHRAELVSAWTMRQKERAALVASRTRLRKLMVQLENDELSWDRYRNETLPILTDARRSIDGVQEILIADRDGRIIAGTAATVASVAGTESFERGLTAPFISAPEMNAAGLTATLSAPAKDAEGNPVGVVLITVDASELTEVVGNGSGLGETGEVVALTRIGDELRYLTPVGGKLTAPANGSGAIAKALSGERGFQVDEHDGREFLAEYRPLPFQEGVRPWGVVASIDTEEAYQPLALLRYVVIIIGGILSFIGVSLAVLMLRRTCREVEELADAAAHIAEGDLTVHVEPAESREVGALSDAFNEMTTRLARAHHELELRVEQRTRALAEQAEELKRSNADLTSFASVASHDLQEPLRTVARYCKRLQKEYSGELDAQGAAYIDRALGGVERMRELIADLLSFSRLRRAEAREDVDLGVAVEGALANLEAAVAESNTTVELGELPTISGEPGKLRQLFQNVIGNAIKYAGDAPPWIAISAERENDFWHISVVDRGIGFESEYAERIFGLFKRLHAHDEVPGTGIGLATCRRIAELHGGTMWAESEPGKGSVFHVRLPAAAAAGNNDAATTGVAA